ncbi:MAG: heme ABC transporter permease [Pseudomonadota bacterium]
MHWFANPLRFQRLADAAFPYVLVAALALTAGGLWGGLVLAPADYQMGDAFRIIYVHVPTAWLALFAYLTLAVAAVFSIVWRHPLADIYGRAAAPVGAVFCLLALVTGSIWGKPMWGTWWVWDARLTSMLILFFLFLGYSALADAFDDPARGSRAAAILALVGSVNLPIIKFSVDWWNTLHQPASVLRFDGPTIHGSMLWPLLITAVGMQLYFVAVVILRMHATLTERKITNLRLAAEAGDD